MDSRRKLAVRVTLWILLGVQSSQALTITGQVFDAKAQPVQGAEVVVIAGHIEGERISPIVRTDLAGRFQVKADASGYASNSIVVVARKDGYASASDRLYGATIEGRSLLVLETPCVCVGQVIDSDGRPVANAEVQAMAIRGPKEWFTTTTDSQGRFHFNQFSAGAFSTFSIRTSGRLCPWELTSDYSRDGFEVGRSGVLLRLPREVAIRGRVVDNQDRPVSNVDLRIGSRSVKAATVKFQSLTNTTRSDSKGEFAFEGLVEGTYEIRVETPSEGLAAWVGKNTEISIEEGRPVEAVIRVGKGAILEVTVLDARTRRPVTDAEGHVLGGDWGLSARADARGVIRLRVLSGASQLRVISGATGAPEYREWQTAGQLTEGQTARMTVLLPPVPSNRMISGTVTDSQSRPVEGVVVNIDEGEQAVADKNGRFTTPCFRSMEILLAGGATPCVWVRDESRGLAGIALIEGPAKPVRLVLSPVPILHGRIVDPNGHGVLAARVSPLLFDGDVLTDHEGRFELKALPPSPQDNDYYLQVTASGFGSTRRKVFAEGQSGTFLDVGSIQLLPANESVSGVVVDAQGQPAARMPVYVHALIMGEPPGSGASGNTTTNEKGEFFVGGLTRGAASVQGNVPQTPEGCGSLITLVPARHLRVILGRDLWAETSLVGRPLPDPGQWCSDLAQFNAEGRPVLVYFTSTAGERSRQLLLKLAAKSRVLAASNVAVIVFETANVNPRQFEEFVEANSLPFPIHVVEGDFEAKKIPWCVKRTPWLILADTRHIVRAEGLEIDKLEEAIAQLR